MLESITPCTGIPLWLTKCGLRQTIGIRKQLLHPLLFLSYLRQSYDKTSWMRLHTATLVSQCVASIKKRRNKTIETWVNLIVQIVKCFPLVSLLSVQTQVKVKLLNNNFHGALHMKKKIHKSLLQLFLSIWRYTTQTRVNMKSWAPWKWVRQADYC